MAETIVVLDALSKETVLRMRALAPPGMVLTAAHSRDPAHLKEIIAGAEYAVTGQIGVDGELLRVGKRLKLLHKWGVGVDNLDLEAARALGVTVARTAGSNAQPVAEFTVGLMIALMRNLALGHAALKGGEWRGLGAGLRSVMLSGRTVGIVGFGAIGQALARCLSGFACTILYNKTRPLAEEEEQRLGVRYAALPELLAQSDIVSLHCPLTPETSGLVDRAALRRMKPGAVLVNVARGGVVNESDLVAALEAGEIAGAAMDVFETEPLPPDHPLLRLENVVLTPHIAASATDNFEKGVRHVFDNIARVARGEKVPPRDLVA